jgi:transcriptional regulator with XRE-family HTH domain
VGVSRDAISKYERDEVKPSIEMATQLAEALEISLDYLTGLSDLELDKSIVDVVTSLQKLNNEDREQIFTAINALIRDAKTRNTCA